jgi:hypothetical protein
MSPAGATVVSVQQILYIVMNTRPVEHFNQFFFETSRPMMFLLPINIALDA